MTFTVEQLEALKEGAPVMHRSSTGAGDRRTHSVKADNGMLRALVGYGPDGGTAYKDAELFAASPALLDQLIATKKELQRVQQGIEELRDSYMEDGGTVGSTQEEQIELYTHGETAKILTQTLEGNA